MTLKTGVMMLKIQLAAHHRNKYRYIYISVAAADLLKRGSSFSA